VKIALSPDERRVAVELMEGGRREIRLLDLATGAFPLLAYQPGVSQLDPVWSPDSRRIAIAANTGSRGEIREIDVSTMRSTVLYADAEMKFLDDWSSDGSYLAFHSGSEGGGSRALRLPGDEQPMLLQELRAGQWDQLSFSPDGKFIAFNSISRAPEVHIASFPDLSHRRQVSVGGGFQARWSRDGQQLYFVGAKGELMSAAVRRSADGSLEPGAPKPMFHLGLANGAWTQYEVAAGGRKLLAIQPVKSGRGDLIHVIVNWPSMLRR
jgi:Tol biopolymer transport system component